MPYDVVDLSPLKQHWLMRRSNIPARFWGHDADSIREFTGDYPFGIENWVSEALSGQIIKTPGGLGTTGVGLMFDGQPGMGKTTHAVSVLTEFLRNLPDDDLAAQQLLHIKASDYGFKFSPVYYLTFTEFLSKKKAMFDAPDDEKTELYQQMEGLHGRSKEDWRNVRILMLDDVGKEYGSKYDDFSFDDILRSRYDRGLPTIVTTNKPREVWSEAYSEAMGSFAHEAFTRIELASEDLRVSQ